MAAAEPIVPKAKLKINFGSKNGSQFTRWLPATNVCGCKKYGSEFSEITYSDDICATQPEKRLEPPVDSEEPPKKRLKMDRNITRQCSSLLKTLMEHRYGWIFNQPVDPVKLNIPDYFSVISNPMDLGTIKTKLEKNVYRGIGEFSADIRLTFSNAMLYNPPCNQVHQVAKTLKELFEVRWKLLEQNLKLEAPKVLPIGKSSLDGCNNSVSSRVTENVQARRYKPADVKVKNVPANATPLPTTPKLNGLKVVQKSASHDVTRGLQKGSNQGGRTACGLDEAKKQDSDTTKCCPCDRNNFFSATRKLTCAPSSDPITRKACADNSSVKQEKDMFVSKTSKPDPGSNAGAESCVDYQNTCPALLDMVSSTDDESCEGWTKAVKDVQMSPKKALRAAMIRSRFSDTILKAKQRTLLDHNNKADPLMLQQEKERLKKKHLEEKGRIEAEIKAAEAAARLKVETELKEQRERQREAARVALQEMERTVHVEDNLDVERELDTLLGFKDVADAFKSGAYLLEKLGLFKKDWPDME